MVLIFLVFYIIAVVIGRIEFNIIYFLFILGYVVTQILSTVFGGDDEQ